MQKKRVLSGILFTLQFAYLIGGSSIEERLSNLEQRRSALRIVKPDLDKKNLFFLSGDYLYWQTSVYGISYACSVNEISPFEINILANEFPFKTNSGFRLGTGYRLPLDNWEVMVHWTWLKSKVSGISVPSTNTLVYTNYEGGILPSSTSYMTALWKFHLNILDGEVGRYFKITKCIAFKPHVGIRGLWIDQKTLSNYYGGSDPGGGLNLYLDTSIYKNNFAGAGLVAGLDSEWEMGKGWSLFGNGGASLIYGTFDAGIKSFVTISEYPGHPFLANHPNTSLQVVFTSALALGVQYERICFCDTFALLLRLGWEFNAFFGQNKRAKALVTAPSLISVVTNNGDLATQGLTLSARIDF